METLSAKVGPIYRPRNPRNSPLYRCVRRHLPELEQADAFKRRIEKQVLERFIACGDLHRGFARIRCKGCGHEYLLAYSCKTRCFCPSCHQKRMLVYGDWVEEQVLAPVPHRQYVFTLPRLLRPHFKYRPFLGELCRLIGQLLTECFHAVDRQGRPAFILFVQTFGNLVTFQPHVHALVADGVFHTNGVFRVLPPIPTEALEKGLREKVFALLKREGGIDDKLIARMRTWRHTGFSTHNGVKLRARDAQGRRQLARYMIRPPLALDKMQYVETSGTVIYRSKMHATLKRNFQVLPGTQWLQLLIQHIPDKFEHTVRYL